MSYDDSDYCPEYVEPTKEQKRIAELEAIIENEADIRAGAIETRERAATAEIEVQRVNREYQKDEASFQEKMRQLRQFEFQLLEHEKLLKLRLADDGELAQSKQQFHNLNSRANDLEKRVKEIDAAKVELVHLSPAAKLVAELLQELHEATFHKGRPIRPELVKKIKDCPIELEPTAKWELSQHDKKIEKIESRIAQAKFKVGVTS
jgi:DNA repair exonuclease SbcCD ATPase subunit